MQMVLKRTIPMDCWVKWIKTDTRKNSGIVMKKLSDLLSAQTLSRSEKRKVERSLNNFSAACHKLKVSSENPFGLCSFDTLLNEYERMNFLELMFLTHLYNTEIIKLHHEMFTYCDSIILSYSQMDQYCRDYAAPYLACFIYSRHHAPQLAYMALKVHFFNLTIRDEYYYFEQYKQRASWFHVECVKWDARNYVQLLIFVALYTKKKWRYDILQNIMSCYFAYKNFWNMYDKVYRRFYSQQFDFRTILFIVMLVEYEQKPLCQTLLLLDYKVAICNSRRYNWAKWIQALRDEANAPYAEMSLAACMIMELEYELGKLKYDVRQKHGDRLKNSIPVFTSRMSKNEIHYISKLFNSMSGGFNQHYDLITSTLTGIRYYLN